MSDINIIQNDILKWAAEYDGEPFMALLCDPPYELNFMGKHWDKSGIAFDPATWAALAQHLHPGAFGMAFASARGWHRLAVAIEDGGLIIHPSLFGFAYGSGFPKATRIKYTENTEWLVAFVDVEGELFNGHRYGLQALKPALEPIIVFQKPYEGRPVDCITATGAGSLWVDGSRIPLQSNEKPYNYPNGSGGSHGPVPIRINYTNPVEGSPAGRWPANLIICDEEAAAALDRQSGVSKSSSDPYRFQKTSGGWKNQPYGNQIVTIPADSGGASRFFYNVQQQLDEADPVRYCTKASRRERDAGLEGLKLKPPIFGDDGETYKGLSNSKNRVHNPHPTLKPLDLCRYLATLLLPPPAYAPRRILVPFAGVMSEAIGARLAGWEQVTAIEAEAEYCDIGRARVEHWTAAIQLELI